MGLLMDQALLNLRSIDLDQAVAVSRSKINLVDGRPSGTPIKRREAPSQSVCDPAGRRLARVLVAEDTPSIAFLVQRFLEQLGCTVRVVANGHAAVEHIKNAARCNQPFDLVIMDLQMPIMSGFDAIATIKSFESSLPILAMTAGSADLGMCRQHGFTGLITKPINRQAFDEAVASNLQAA